MFYFLFFCFCKFILFFFFFFFSSRRRHTRFDCDWSSEVCSSDLGVEWGYGAMGCARWKGARLKDVLDKIGVKKDAIEVVFDGADGPVIDKTPDFIKSIPVWKAMEDSTLIAYEMNGQPLP